MSRAFVFPGQGSQVIGMGKAVAEMYPEAAAIFEIVDNALEEKLSELIFSGSEEELRLTRNAQPALMATSLAVIRAIETESGRSLSELASCLAGHSLGEYSALAASDSLNIADSARLLRLRGDAMQSAVQIGEGSMAALIGADLNQAEEVISIANSEGTCVIANDNAPGQVVVSGASGAIKKVIDIAKDYDIKKAVLLPVSAPFHCPMMRPAAEAMSEALNKVQLKKPTLPIISNVTAQLESDPNKIKDLLTRQVTAQVRWRESILTMSNVGVTKVAEVGAGKVLTGLIKRIDPDLDISSINSPDGVKSFVSKL